MTKASCHCGVLSVETDAPLTEVMECNCSHCIRKGFLLAFVPRDQATVTAPENETATYLFNKHAIEHHFCVHCGVEPFAYGKNPDGSLMTAINVRCVERVDLKSLKITPLDGAHRL